LRSSCTDQYLVYAARGWPWVVLLPAAAFIGFKPRSVGDTRHGEEKAHACEIDSMTMSAP
jgi:hypothetical protein